MSKIEELIKELCPNGVEYKELYELTFWDKKFNGVSKEMQPKIIKYNHLLASELNKYEVENGDVKILSTGSVEGWTTFELTKDIVSDGEIVSIPWGGTPRVKYYKGKFITGDNRISTSRDNKILDNKYLYHYLNSSEKMKEIESYYRGSGIKHPHMLSVLKMKIALPPLSIQNEIVRILDNFAELTAELIGEQTLRQHQYEYYREKLLNKIEGEVEYKTIGEIFSTITDYVAGGSFAQTAANVKYLKEPSFAQLIRTTDIKSNHKKEDVIYVDERAFNFLWRVNLNEPALILPNVGNCGEVYYLEPQTLPFEKNVLGPNALLMRGNYNDKFYYYYFQTRPFQKMLQEITSNTGQTKYNKTNLKTITIPVPSLEEQQRIVDILDRFDALANDINNGLPAEVKLRQQQYEYYRDKLLTFKEKE